MTTQEIIDSILVSFDSIPTEDKVWAATAIALVVAHRGGRSPQETSGILVQALKDIPSTLDKLTNTKEESKVNVSYEGLTN